MLYFREVRLQDGVSVALDDSFHQKCINIFNRILEEFNSYGLIKSKVNFIYLGKEDGIYYMKMKLKTGPGKFSTRIDEFSCYHKDDLHSHIKGYIDYLTTKNGIVLFITDKDKVDEFKDMIQSFKSEYKLKRKAEILL